MANPTKTQGAQNDIVTVIPEVPITKERKPFRASASYSKLIDPGAPRANIAASQEAPHGTKDRNWASQHKDQTVLQQHCDFFDPDQDGIIYPHDTFSGFYKLGFGFFLSLLAVFIIHANFSYPTLDTFIPDPLFRVYIKNIHKDKHGSGTGVYDNEGRFVPQKFEDIFSKYADGQDFISSWQLWYMLKGQRLISDPIGWFAAFFEWLATFIMLWPDDGKLKKEDIRAIYDGSIFYTVAARQAKQKAGRSGQDF
ncbi:hypothetical protein AJ79_01742 [Helicocarpus griseus UAMH5409]|uniref:EF-hand domain-containing protein n=1 Tax=Helicocarpus griseus UAMH5409 TaxID=1447875 RepID=A0A2B7Y5Y0_9EURO|nr:hypothetical protein AJ79_01742 [Helicocarpus griseus UAMH5409]